MSEPADVTADGAFDLIARIEEEFGGVAEPVSAEHVARLYGVMAAQSDAIRAMYALAMKGTPQLVLSEQRIELERAMSAQVDALGSALLALAKDYGKTESVDE